MASTLTRPIVAERRRTRPDIVLIGSVVALTAMGVIMIYSITRVALERNDLPASFSMERQLIFVTAGLLLMLAVSRLDYREYRNFLPLIYAVTIVLLLVVFLFPPVQGARRWIPLGAFKFQPGEFAKLVVILAVAAVLSPDEGDASVTWRRIGQAFAIMALPTVLIFAEPDLGTSGVIPFVVLVMLFGAGLSWRRLGVIATVGALIGVAVFRFDLLQEYQLNRLRVLFDPELDPQGIGYNLRQSKLAIASGQLFGRGLFEGVQTNLQYVPEQETDFIFTAVGEQLGFIGGLAVLVAFLILIWRILAIAASARDRFGSLVAVGIAAMFMFHVFINIGMTMGIAPVTGLPLPFMSQGGSSYLAMTFAVGIANSIWLRRSPTPGDPIFG